MAIKAMTNSLRWLSDLLAFFQVEAINIPTKYRDRVIEVKKLLMSDTSGIVNSVLDFSINCALVDFTVETDNPNLTKILNNWLRDINSDLIGKIPTGISAVAKEYYTERWKSSSHLLLRTFWNKKNDIELPTVMFFLDGEDIKTKNGGSSKVLLGKEKYFIRISADEKDDIPLPKEKNELIFVQRPYENWGVLEPIPFVIRKGLFRNLHFMTLMSQKGEYIFKKALEYLFTIKKGTERMALEGRADMIYSEEDLRKVKDDFGQLLINKKTDVGTPTYASNFDTELEHLIPDYTKAVNETIYAPIERRLLAGLGLIDIVTGTASSRREALLNPKPFISEVNQAIKDFKMLLTDVLRTIISRNDNTHRKWMNAEINIRSTPVQEFIDDKFRAMIRSGHDRGKVSGRTFVEIGLNQNYDLEVQRRLDEKKKGHDKTMYPPVIQNVEGQSEAEDIPSDKKTIEKKNFLQSIYALEETECPHCGEIFDFELQTEIEIGSVQCPNCEKIVSISDLEESYEPIVTKNYIRVRQKDPSVFNKDSFRIISLSKSKGIKAVIGRLKNKSTTTIQSYLFEKNKWSTEEAKKWIIEHKGSADDYEIDINLLPEFSEELYSIVDKEYEQAPYDKNVSLPKSVKVLPSAAQSLWRRVFNQNYGKGEDYARRVAWFVVKKSYKKSGDKWVRKSKSKGKLAIEISEALEMKKLEVLDKQSKLLDEINKEGKDETVK